MPYPPTFATYTSVVRQLGEHAVTEVDRVHRDLEKAKTNLTENLRELERRTNHFIEEGWADLRRWHSMPVHPYGAEYGHKRWDWRQYFRRLSKDMHRPFIWVVEAYRSPPLQSGVYLHIPRRKNLLPLSAAFLLLYKQTSHNTVEWIWHLDHDQFEWWRNQIHHDDQMLEALWQPQLARPNR